MEEVMHNQGTTPHPAAEVRGGRHAPHPDQPGADRAELAHHLAGLVPPEQDAEAVKDHAKEVAASHAGPPEPTRTKGGRGVDPSGVSRSTQMMDSRRAHYGVPQGRKGA